MQNLIPVINKVQEIFAQARMPMAVDLPMIAVVGAQSTGKSSVLESIIGKDFLPRGSGIVTRRPLTLQLHNLKEGTDYAVFAHRPDRVFNDFDLVRKEIEAETDRIAGKTKGVSPEPIILKIYSKSVLDLTLVDLPGLTKVPVNDQPLDIEQIIRDMVVNVVKNENCLILAVSAGNTDIANSDSLKLAREVDPQGNRTIGVITKLDILDRGTVAMDVLDGKVYPLKLGYVGVVCRSQKDIQDSKRMTDALKAEEDFFARHPSYSQIKERCGIKFLSQRLNKLLMENILSCIPSLKQNITTMLHGKMKEVSGYGIDLASEGKDKRGALLLYLISKFAEYYQSSIDGSFVQESTTELRGGARIYFIFHKIFARAIKEITALDGLTDEDIRTAIMNSKSLHPSLFIPEKAFENLIRQQITRLLDPSLQCMHLVHEELKRIVIHPELAELCRFSTLMSKMPEIMNEVLQNCVRPTEEMIRSLIIVEDAFINVNHPDVLNGTSAILGMMQPEIMPPMQSGSLRKHKSPKKSKRSPEKHREENGIGILTSIFGNEGRVKAAIEEAGDEEAGARQEQPAFPFVKVLPEIMRADTPATSREVLETEIIKQLLFSYFEVVKKNITDLVPKTIMAFLVNKSKSIAQNELVSALYVGEDMDALLAENPMVLQQRKDCKKTIAALQESLKAIQEISVKGLSAE
ncbi:MAG: dynamin family protein [Candidatus Pacebacteria bacterium]|nr:dynamin family protein [Candidatus Paceibacterota bacterium]